MKKHRIAIALLAAALLLSAGCYGDFGGWGNKRLTEHFGKSPVVSARYYEADGLAGGTYTALELPEEQLEDLLAELQELRVRQYWGHVDYNWGGLYGLELTLEDGSCVSYDGTCLARRSASYLEDPRAERLERSFLEVTNGDFWSVMDSYFQDTLPNRYR